MTVAVCPSDRRNVSVWLPGESVFSVSAFTRRPRLVVSKAVPVSSLLSSSSFSAVTPDGSENSTPSASDSSSPRSRMTLEGETAAVLDAVLFSPATETETPLASV